LKIIVHVLVPPDDFEATRKNARAFLEGVKKASKDTYSVEPDAHISVQSQDSVSSIIETPPVDP
jgi:hypothetical protein